MGLGIDDPVWVPTVFTKNRDRLLSTNMSRKVMAAIPAHREVALPLAGDHFSVDRTLVKAWALMKSFQPKADDTPPDDDPGSPPGPDATAEGQTEPTEVETTPMPPPHPPEPQYRSRPQGREADQCHSCLDDRPRSAPLQEITGTDAMLCCMGHVLMENRSGLIVQGDLTQADGHAERRVALDMIHRRSPGATRGLTLGADSGSTRPNSSLTCEKLVLPPHVAQKSRHSAIGCRTTRHEGYALSIGYRKPIEEAFGWAKAVGGMAQTFYRGLERVRSRFILTMATNNLARLPRLLAA